MVSFQDAPDENIEHDEKMELRCKKSNCGYRSKFERLSEFSRRVGRKHFLRAFLRPSSHSKAFWRVTETDLNLNFVETAPQQIRLLSILLVGELAS